MSYQLCIRTMIEKYGTQAVIKTKENCVYTKAFVQPLRYKSKLFRDKEISCCGITDGRYYQYIGSPEYEFSRFDEAIITIKGDSFVVHSSETVIFDNKKLYVSAILKRFVKQREDYYDTDSKQY